MNVAERCGEACLANLITMPRMIGKRMIYLLYVLIVNWFAVCMGQLLFLGQASKVRDRFAELGKTMQADHNRSIYWSSKFWDEARQLNSELGDVVVKKILHRRGMFTTYAIISFVALVFVAFVF